jgi:hypothetical protein
MSKKEVMDRVASLGLREYGVYHDKLADIWDTLLSTRDSESLPIHVVAALNNNDTVRVLLDLLRTNAEKVMQGMKIAAYVLDAADVLLYIPQEESELKEKLDAAARDMGIQICCDDFVDRRLFPNSAFHHIETMVALTDALLGEGDPGVYAAVMEKDKMGELCKIPFKTKISDLVQSKAEDIQGIEINSKLYDASALDLMIDENFSMGNGVITVLDKASCIIDETEKRLLSSMETGCGKCTFCREGILQLYMMLKDITKGKGKVEYLSLLKEIGEAIPYSTVCSVGQTGSLFMLDSISGFHEEYENHIKKKKCQAGVCTAFVPMYIDPELCNGCQACVDVCPEDCIEGKAGYIHMKMWKMYGSL